jgi:hypothetical protein
MSRFAGYFLYWFPCGGGYERTIAERQGYSGVTAAKLIGDIALAYASGDIGRLDDWVSSHGDLRMAVGIGGTQKVRRLRHRRHGTGFHLWAIL